MNQNLRKRLEAHIKKKEKFNKELKYLKNK